MLTDNTPFFKKCKEYLQKESLPYTSLLEERHISKTDSEEVGQAKCIFTSTLEMDLMQILTLLGGLGVRKMCQESI